LFHAFKEKKYAYFMPLTADLIAAAPLLSAIIPVEMNLHFFNTKPLVTFGSVYLIAMMASI
jgi:hypothetical protein